MQEGPSAGDEVQWARGDVRHARRAVVMLACWLLLELIDEFGEG